MKKYLNKQKKIFEAKALADAMKKTELTPALLLTCIISDPSEPIKSILGDEILNFSLPDNEDVTGGLKDELNPDVNTNVPKNSIESADEFEDEPLDEPKGNEVSEEYEWNPSIYKKEEMTILVNKVKHIRKELSKEIFGQDI